MCLYAHQHFFGKWGYIWDVLSPSPAALRRPVKRRPYSPASHPDFISVCFYFFAFHCSHPDCLKLPHAEKQKSDQFKSGADQNQFLLSGGSEWPSLLWVALSSQGATSSVIQSLPNAPPPHTPLIPTSLISHTHTPPCRTGASGWHRGRPGASKEAEAVRKGKARVGCLCVCEGVYIF